MLSPFPLAVYFIGHMDQNLLLEAEGWCSESAGPGVSCAQPSALWFSLISELLPEGHVISCNQGVKRTVPRRTCNRESPQGAMAVLTP